MVGNNEKVAKTLALWKKDTDLAGIRGEQELAKLPQNERRKWQSLRTDIEALLKPTGS